MFECKPGIPDDDLPLAVVAKCPNDIFKVMVADHMGFFGPTMWHYRGWQAEIIASFRWFAKLRSASDGLPSFAWFQQFACLPCSASCELREKWNDTHTRAHTHKHRHTMLIVWARSMGMTYFWVLLCGLPQPLTSTHQTPSTHPNVFLG